jgi:hypothetical protein
MTLAIDPWLAALFGSGARVRTLAPLANTDEPMTAYRIAKLVGLQRIKVYSELRHLARAGVVRELRVGEKRSVWFLSDPDVRRLLQKRARVVSVNDIERAAPGLARQSRAFRAAYVRNPIDLSRFKSEPSKVGAHEEYRRSPAKDRVLASLGLRTSSRTRRRR